MTGINRLRELIANATPGPRDGLWFGDKNDPSCGHMAYLDMEPNGRGLWLDAAGYSHIDANNVRLHGPRGFTRADARFIRTFDPVLAEALLNLYERAHEFAGHEDTPLERAVAEVDRCIADRTEQP